MVAFKKAIKAESKLRMALAGPSGSGKTFTALMLATSLANGKPVAVIDTERGSASKYADLFEFDVLELEDFHPDRYVEAIEAAARDGYGVIVIDSLSHAWNGTNGLLEQVEQIGKRKYNGNSFKAWGDVKPSENRMVAAITGNSIHVIATMRSKTEYVVEQNERGKATPRKVGMAPVQRDGFEYEFDVFGEMTPDNELLIQKTRCSALTGQVISKPGAGLAQILAEWLRGVKREDLDALTTPAVEQTREWDAARDTDVVKALRTLRFTQNKEQYEYLAALRREFDEAGRAWDHDSVMAHLRAKWQEQRDAEKRAATTPALEALDMGAPGN